MKVKGIALSLILCLGLSMFAGCAPKQTPAPSPTPTPGQTSPPESTPNVTTSASIVDNAAAFQKAISSTGTWIIAVTKDITSTTDLVLAGEFKNGKKDTAGKDIIQRKIALYTQDDKRNVTGRFTLTAPKLTIQSPEAGLWYGTFKGDIYVSAKDFSLIGAKVDGNVYFTTDEAQATFKKDAASTITGTTALKK
jgi:hypothetical protein